MFVPLFSTAHLTFIVILIGLSYLSIQLKKFSPNSSIHLFFRFSLLSILVTNEISWFVFRHTWLNVPLKDNLPLHLCDFSFFMVIIGLLLPQKKIASQLCYYIGVSGSLFAILLPDISETDSLQTIAVMRYFITHMGIFIVGLYLTFGRNFKPNSKAPLQSFVVLLLYTGFIGIMNHLLGTNYMFLNQKPTSVAFLNNLSQVSFLAAATILVLFIFIILHLLIIRKPT